MCSGPGLMKLGLARLILALLCVIGNAFGKRDARSIELQTVVESTNLFAEDVYNILIKPEVPEFNSTFENKNVIFSPLSIYIGLAMLMAGAEGNTEKEIFQALCLMDDSKEATTQKGFYELIRTLQDNCEDKAVQIQLAKRILVGQVYPIKPGFLQSIRLNFFANAEQINFRSGEKPADKVNQWVQDATRDLLRPLLYQVK